MSFLEMEDGSIENVFLVGIFWYNQEQLEFLRYNIVVEFSYFNY